MRDLTDVIVGFHSRAEVIHDQDGRSVVEQTIRDNNANWFSLISLLTLTGSVTVEPFAKLSAVAELLEASRPQERSAAATETSIYGKSACSKTIIIRLYYSTALSSVMQSPA